MCESMSVCMCSPLDVCAEWGRDNQQSGNVQSSTNISPFSLNVCSPKLYFTVSLLFVFHSVYNNRRKSWLLLGTTAQRMARPSSFRRLPTELCWPCEIFVLWWQGGVPCGTTKRPKSACTTKNVLECGLPTSRNNVWEEVGGCIAQDGVFSC